MCQAFACLVLPGGEVLWEFGVDNHEALIKKHSLVDNTCDPAEMTFCRVEYAPRNGSYLKPDGWELRVDQERPVWWSARHAKAVKAAWKTWKAKLDRILVYKRIVKPFEDKKPPKKITEKHISLLREWASVGSPDWSSRGDFVNNAVGASVKHSVGFTIRNSVWALVNIHSVFLVDRSLDRLWESVLFNPLALISFRALVWAYVGSFFRLPRKAWQGTEAIKCSGYPFQPAVDLWEMGLVPIYDGNVWRLHGGPDAKVLWEGALEKE